MWKPGTSKPSSKQSDASNDAPDKSPKQDDGGGSAKKLSSSTMGMRFMQRKNVQSKEADEKKELQHAARRKSADNTASNGDKANRGDGAGALDRKRDSMEISSNTEHSTTFDGVIILELASVTDMYGVGSDIVGRRSFGGFHKSVRSTWDAALKRRTDNEARTKNTRAHITDEELLERYEKYVKGGGRSSGNGGRKEKRKRKSHG